MLKYADVCLVFKQHVQDAPVSPTPSRMMTYAVTYADVRRRMLTHASFAANTFKLLLLPDAVKNAFVCCDVC
jgi:hypothetical protein